MTPEQEQQAIVAATNAVNILHALDCTLDMEPEFRVTMNFGAGGYQIRLTQLVENEWLMHTIPDSGDFIAADIFTAIAMSRDLRAKASTPKPTQPAPINLAELWELNGAAVPAVNRRGDRVILQPVIWNSLRCWWCSPAGVRIDVHGTFIAGEYGNGTGGSSDSRNGYHIVAVFRTATPTTLKE